MLFREERPWGWFEVLYNIPTTIVKVLHVNPGQRLSLQRHFHRSELWKVIKGQGIITYGEDREQIPLDVGDVFTIEKGEIHRLSSLENTEIEIIEIQTGDKLFEEDIERIEDDYGRS
jgi:mannose-6-phosphate isomerase-like protein (cupin superfamily)